ncbi:hypothetical protein ON058_05805 [Demequina sp. B12]|uniref:hypothetical protein n=1 Tax=Demequina sp. B12 TaxID=2992757 RepID=UPI00237A3E31|nr:hypothetical protein [Demequina sp. B12]MDE0572925.1 hypothetical protein [Demequina sp. B12]
MKYVRSIASAFLVVLGSMLVVAWALSQKAADSIEDGTAAENLVVSVVRSEQTAEVIANGVVLALENQVDGRIGTFALGLLEQQIHDLTVDAVESEAFQDLLLTGADRAQNVLLAEISDPEREPAPFGIYLDPGARLNDRINEIPVVGLLAPEITIEPVAVDIIDAETFEDVRSGYQALVWAAHWFGWIGAALIAGGIAIAPRWKWFLPRALVGAGAIGVGVALTLEYLGPRTIAAFVPGGPEGGLGTLIEDVVADAALAPLTTILLTLGLVALGIALAFVLALRFIPGGTEDDEPSPTLEDRQESEATTAGESH